MKTPILSHLQASCFLAVLFCTRTLAAQQTSITTTATLPAVTVIGKQVLPSRDRIATPSSVLTAAHIQLFGARQIADALAFVPGVFVKNYGGLGGLKTISLRGGTASQTAVLLDGVRVQSSQNGQFDFSTIPASLLESVEVVRGGGTAIFGGGTMSGAVNIRMKSLSVIERAEVSLSGEVASFEERRAFATVATPFSLPALGIRSGSIVASGEYQTARGNYPFPFNDFGQTQTLQRDNADFRLATGMLFATVQTASEMPWRLQSRIIARSSERGSPGAVVQGNIEMLRARLADDDALALVTASHAPSTASTLTLLASLKRTSTLYTDPDARQFGASGINERFTAYDASLSARFHVNATGEQFPNYELLAEAAFADLAGNMLQRDVGNYIRRLNVALAANVDNNWRLGDARFASQAAMRLDYYSDAGAAVSPLLGTAWLLDSSTRFRGQWTYNFRPPAFNELYYLNFGTASLKPERSSAWSLGFTGNSTFDNAPQNRFTTSVDAFFHEVENQIIAVPTSPFTISAQNIARVQTYGLETSFEAVFGDVATLTTAYTFQRAVNETPGSFARGRVVMYTPEHLANATLRSAKLVLGNWQLQSGCTAQFVGSRYSLPSNAEESLLPAYALLNVFLQADVAFALDMGTPTVQAMLRLQCDNFFDERYAVIRNFPMPGRAVRLVVRLSN
jgi:vitamin B12 transporter